MKTFRFDKNIQISLDKSKSEPVKLLIVINNLTIAGAEITLGEILKRLNHKHISCLIAMLGGPEDLRPEFEKNGCKVICLNPHGKSGPVNIIKLMRLIRKEKIDIISTHLYPSNLWGPLAGKFMKRPVVSSIHNALVNRSIRTLIPEMIGLRFSDRIRAVSDNAKGNIRKYYKIPAKRLTVIKNGREPRHYANFRLDQKQKQFLQKKWGFNDQVFLIGNVARFSPIKGIEILISSFRLIRKSIPNAKLMLIGDGPLLARLRQMASQKGLSDVIIFTGNQFDIRPFLSRIDLFVLPSLSEGMSNVLVEAMMMAKPIIATRVGGNTEIIEHGKTGFLIEPGSLEAIADAVCKMHADKERMIQFGIAARHRAIQLFDINKKALEFQNMLLEMLQ